MVVAGEDIAEVVGTVGGHPDDGVLVTEGGVVVADVGDAVAGGGDSSAAGSSSVGGNRLCGGDLGVAVVLRHLVGHLELEADEIDAARAEVHGVERVLLAQRGAVGECGGAGLGYEGDDVLGVDAEFMHVGADLVAGGDAFGRPGIEPEERVVGVGELGLFA